MNLNEQTLWMTSAALLTIFTLSFLYKDNPFYKIAEHLVVGVSAGYFTMLLIVSSLWPKLVNPLKTGEWWYIIPGCLGLMMFFRFSKKRAWISRYPIAIYIGIGTGLSLILEMQAKVVEQLNATIGIAGSLKAAGASGAFLTLPVLWDLIILVGVVCGLAYFFFSKEHTGVFGGAATVGIWMLMVGFGASFGYTVMARISLFIQRVQFLGDWWNALFA
jgi:hypothetical protein